MQKGVGQPPSDDPPPDDERDPKLSLMSDALGRRADAARSTVGDSLAEVVDELARREEAASHAARVAIERTAAERLEVAIADFRSRAEKHLSDRAQALDELTGSHAKRLEHHLEQALAARLEEVGRLLEERASSSLAAGRSEVLEQLGKVAAATEHRLETAAAEVARGAAEVGLAAAREQVADELTDELTKRSAEITRELRALAETGLEAAEQRTAAAALAAVAAAEHQLAMRLEQQVSAAVESELGEARPEVLAQSVAELRAEFEAGAEKVGRRDRRHELKLARAETSRRIETALERLERRSTELTASFEERAAELEGAMIKLEGALAAIGRSEGRIQAAEERVGLVGRQAVETVAAADRTAEFEARIREATRVEEEAAARIRAAERRLLERTSTDLLGD